MAVIGDVVGGLVDSFKNREVWVFAGAGISVNSGLPLVSQLVPRVLENLGVSKQDIESYKASSFCFEEFVQILLRSGDDEDAHELLDLFRKGKPNTNHHLLAKLVTSGYLKTIVTTNFDLLIERALAEQGLKQGVDFTVLHREADFETIDWNDRRPAIVKIHGSIEDSDAMATTVERVARKELSSRRRGIIERAFASGTHENVLILGYSSSDVFDISPHIATLGGKLKRVVVVEHRRPSASPSVENLVDRADKNPFKQFAGSLRLHCDTDRFVKTLWRALLSTDIRSSPRQTTQWEACVDFWCRLTDFGNRGRGFAIAGRIFYSVSEFHTAQKYLERAASLSSSYYDDDIEIDVLLGNICARLGDLERAVIAHFGPAFERLQRAESTRSLIELMTSAARLFIEHGESDKALRYCSQAFMKARELGDEKETTAVQAEWGNAWNQSGAFPLAKRVLTVALEKADHQGDVRTKASILGYLGDSHAALQEHEKAIGYYEEAIEADRNLGHKRGEAVHVSSMGDVYGSLGDHQRAIDCYRQALRIADAMADYELKAITLAVMGSIHLSTGAHDAAIGEYREVVKICTHRSAEEVPGKESSEPARAKRLRLQYRQTYDRQFSEFLTELEESGLEGTPEGTEAFRKWARDHRELLKKSEAPAALARTEPVLTMRLKADAWVGLGDCYVKSGQIRAAIEAYEQGETFLSIVDKERHSRLVSLLEELRKRAPEAIQ